MTIEEMQKKRKELGFSYEMLSSISGVPLGTVRKIFGGITSSPRYGTIQRLTAALTGYYPLSEDQTVCFSSDVDWEENGRVRESAAPYDGGSAARIIDKKGVEDLSRWIDPARQGSYTIDDLERFPEHFRVELDDGRIIVMESPSLVHQELVSSLQSSFYNFIRKKRGACRVIAAPFDLHFRPEDKKNCRQPDLMVVCDRNKLTLKHCMGGPDLVVEVLSPSTTKTDMIKKQWQYSDIGVREYWIIDPKKEKILVYLLEQDVIPEIYGFTDHVPVHIWPGEKINFKEIREEISYALAMQKEVRSEGE